MTTKNRALIAGIAVAVVACMSLTARGVVTEGDDTDPEIYLEPDETIMIDGEPFTNQAPNRVTVKICPGKGEPCKIKVGLVSYEEEKSEGSAPIVITRSE